MKILDIKDGIAKLWRKMKPGDFAVFSVATYAKYAQVRGSAYRLPRVSGGWDGPKFVARKTGGKGIYPTYAVISCHDSAKDPETLARVEFEVAAILERVRAHLDTLVIAQFDEPKGPLRAKVVDAEAKTVDPPMLELVG
jgi:hypothetical protein